MPAPCRRVHAFADDALGEHDAVGLVEELQARRVGVREVVEAAIARTETVDAELGTVAYRAYDRARTEARDPRGGYFAGVPTFVKDNVDVAGMPTLHGTDAWIGRPCRRDGDLARMLLATGLLPLGKSRLSEYGLSASAEHPRLGPVRSPWSLSHTAGASSAGAAALVAAGAVPLAHANDGGGSIRIPASVNGLVGLKPTAGRLAQDALTRRMPVRLVADGVVTRSVRDTAAFLRESERVYRALHLPPVGEVTRPLDRPLRVAVHTASDGHLAHPDVAARTLESAALLASLGHHVEEVPVPAAPGFGDDFVLYWSLLALVLVRTGRRTHGSSWDPTRLDSLTHALARHGARHLHRIPAAVRRLRRARDDSAAFHRHWDVALMPTVSAPTPLLGYLDPTQDGALVLERLRAWVAFTPWHNVTGDPAVSLPLARTEDGLPQGMMLAAGAGREALLLALSLQLEQAAPFPSIRG